MVKKMAKLITKASGKREPFDIKKFRRSLRKSGASKKIIEVIVRDIKKAPELKTTKNIYHFALRALKKQQPVVAARYNLKNALRELGPAGYPFEKFVAEIFNAQGYTTKVDQQVEGKCVSHEIDIVASKKNEHIIVECKFHSHPGKKSDVKVALYTQARFEDIKARYEQEESKKEFHQVWLATNTQFTTVAIKYGLCVDMRLMGWNYPQTDNLPHLIDEYGLHPITALTCLTSREKKYFIHNGLVLCRHAQEYQHLFKQLHLTPKKIKQILDEAEGVCTLKVG